MFAVFLTLTPAFPAPTLDFMEVRLTPDQKAFVRQGIAAGRFQNEADAVAEALALWEERERTRAEFLATLDDAKASLERGEGIVVTRQSMRELAEDVKHRGRARLAAKRSSPR
jgi:Arc/MetJ-type ribon-helix-helix transcriptional regulator